MEKLSALHVNHAFGFHKVLNDISFEVSKGEVVAIVGPSGGGKSTLLRLCAGLLDVTEGQINNTFTSQAFAFQDARLLPWKRVEDNIALGLLAQGRCKKGALKIAREIGLQFGLEAHDLIKFPKDLSGGMRQRVSFARALALMPSLLFLDEPFSALDIGLKRELQDHLIRHVEEHQMSVLFITHDIAEAVRLSDTILVLKSDPGEVIETFALNRAKKERDDDYVHQKTLSFLAHSSVMETFELELR